MKRWLIRITICLLLGVIINAITAGWLALNAQRVLYEFDGGAFGYAHFGATASCGGGE